MKNYKLQISTIALASILLAAHFLHKGNIPIAFMSAFMPMLLLFKKKWALNILSIFLFLSVVIWFKTALDLIHFRIATEQNWLRSFFIFFFVILFNLFSLYISINFRKAKKLFTGDNTSRASTIAFFTTASFLMIAKLKTHFSILLFDRFFKGAGYIEIFIMAIYAAWLTEKFITSKNSQKLRLNIWKIFSVIFFTQLVLGITVDSIFLMTGTLHFPIPALILAGPIYRGSGLFMPILFLSTVILTGPTWCSYLCYFGVWDNVASNQKSIPESRSRFFKSARWIIFILLIVVALTMHILRAPSYIAIIAASTFGIFGIATIIFISRKKGTMIHCTSYCPIGILSNILGKINPFRIRINNSCSRCNICTTSCRYDALTPLDIQKQKAGFTCTLCGDCIDACHSNAIYYKFFNLKPETAKRLFYILIISAHAIFLALARI